MPYMHDDSAVKCDLDALYSGAYPLEVGCTDEAEIIGYSEGSPVSTSTDDRPVVLEGSPMTSGGLFRQTFPAGIFGWQTP